MWAVWAVLLAAVVAWEVIAFLQHPRAQHPTLSSLANEVLADHPLRALAMLVWLGLGAPLGRP